jgi:hypothetical protein
MILQWGYPGSDWDFNSNKKSHTGMFELTVRSGWTTLGEAILWRKPYGTNEK